MIIFDTETTGLLGPTSLPLEQQPEIVEVGLVKLDSDLAVEVDRLNFFIKPRTPITKELTAIHGITNEMVAESLPFAGYYETLADFFLGEGTLVAHNLPFDRGLLATELQRIDKLLEFPWPPVHICTAELSDSISEDGKRMKQEALYKMATGRDANQTHRALDDVLQLVEIVRWLRTKDLI